MCGRYFIEISEKELQDIAREIEKKTKGVPEQITLCLKASGDIFPTDIVPVQTGVDQYQPMKWGFVGFDGKPMINARSETALEKPMFQKAMLERRCLIPASGYYEWQKSGAKKVKHIFRLPSSPASASVSSATDSATDSDLILSPTNAPNPTNPGLMFFAGCYRQEKGSPLPHFTILTRQAAPAIELIHGRMPVIIPREHARAWLCDGPQGMNYAIEDLIYEAV